MYSVFNLLSNLFCSETDFIFSLYINIYLQAVIHLLLLVNKKLI